MRFYAQTEGFPRRQHYLFYPYRGEKAFYNSTPIFPSRPFAQDWFEQPLWFIEHYIMAPGAATHTPKLFRGE